MWDGYGKVPVTSRAAEAELERQRARRLARPPVEAAGTAEGAGGAEEKERANAPQTLLSSPAEDGSEGMRSSMDARG